MAVARKFLKAGNEMILSENQVQAYKAEERAEFWKTTTWNHEKQKKIPMLRSHSCFVKMHQAPTSYH